MQSIPRYIECRHHPEKVTYKHPLLEPILSVTYGCMIYQEQVMQVFQSLRDIRSARQIWCAAP